MAPAFAAAIPNPFGLVAVGGRSNPTLADINGDGDLDAFIGEVGGDTVFFENTGCGNGGVDAIEECDDGNLNNADGCNTLCQTPSGDADADGVANAVENAGPNNGDGNGDGTPDSTQPDVASLPNAANGSYLTVVADSCALEDVAAVPLAPPGFVLPFGAVAFALPGCPSTKVTFYYHDSDGLSAPPFQYVKRGPNPPGAANDVVYTLSPGPPHGTMFGSAALPFDPAVAMSMFTLTDGVVGDDTAAGDGIFDQGGPGFPLPRSTPALGWSGLGLALAALFGLARRRLR